MILLKKLCIISIKCFKMYDLEVSLLFVLFVVLTAFYKLYHYMIILCG